jgi:endonuclease/exonuclease/phosphatase family metal-dependent hydrolase
VNEREPELRHGSRRHFLVVAGAGLAACAGRPAARNADAASQPGNARALKVLTCNIRLPMAEDDAAGNGWMARRELCAETIAAQQGDLVGLQECRAQQLEFLLEKMPGMQAVGLPHPDLGWSRVNAILYSRKRFEPLYSGGFWLSETPHVEGSKSWDSARARFVNWVQLRDLATQGELRFWNTHFDHLGDVAREQAAAMVIAASQALPKSLPQLFVGDLNSGMKRPGIKALQAAGWLDTFAAIHGPKDPGFTAHTFLGPKRYDGAKRGAKIDWIFCREGTTTLDAEIIRDGRDGRYPSDHYFVSATVVLPAAHKGDGLRRRTRAAAQRVGSAK